MKKVIFVSLLAVVIANSPSVICNFIVLAERHLTDRETAKYVENIPAMKAAMLESSHGE
jgi:hypothetical protein